MVQVGLLTPLTFIWHRLNPLAVFTSGAYFLHNGRRWQWICKVTVPTLKACLKAHSRSVSGNKLELDCRATWCPPPKKSVFSAPSWSSGQLENDPKTLFFPSSRIVQELCESRGGRPELSVLTSLLASVDAKIYWTLPRHWSQLVPNMSADIRGH